MICCRRTEEAIPKAWVTTGDPAKNKYNLFSHLEPQYAAQFKTV
jgi:hypothetical protein